MVYHPVDDCVKEYTTDTGSIMSPGYPGEYPSNYACMYIIRRPTPGSTVVTIVNFDLEYNENCAYDYIKVRKGRGI